MLKAEEQGNIALSWYEGGFVHMCQAEATAINYQP